MKSQEIREKFLQFFEKRGHKIMSSFSLVPENDSSSLFISAGMQPLVPFLLGENHPGGRKLANIQKCLRTEDIDEVGDSSHLTFFEMMGYWSLGDYFKEKSIQYSFDFFTKELKIKKENISVTVFSGDKKIPRDNESAKIWQEKIGIPREKIYFLPKEDNFWIVGNKGPCGPCSEIFYEKKLEKCNKECKPGCSCGKYIEIGNNVFMEYNKKENGDYEKLKQKNVDVGLGLERIAMVLQEKENVFETDLFLPIYNLIAKLSSKKDKKYLRILSDHIKASVFLASEGILPSNLDRGYILRRLLRRSIRFAKLLQLKNSWYIGPIQKIIEVYQKNYPELKEKQKEIINIIQDEEGKFSKVVTKGIKELDKIGEKREKGQSLSDKEAFFLFQTYGFPIELIEEIAKEKNFLVDKEGFKKEMIKHQEASRKGVEKKFKGGLADSDYQTTKLHTATHLLLQALRKVLGKHVSQKGSNITPERLRFDFSHQEKLTKEQIKKIEDLVNKKIKEDLSVDCEEMTLEEAKNQEAIGVFEQKYQDKVKVYSAGDFSKEICGGPHVKNTSELGQFKIKKEESVGAGIRRIKAILI